MRLLRFSPRAEHVPGKFTVVAGSLSRSPVKQQGEREEEEEEFTAEVGEHVRSTVQCLPATLNRLENIKFEQLRDTCLNKVISYTLQGWPEEYSQEDTLGLAPYWEARSHLSVIESSLFTY